MYFGACCKHCAATVLGRNEVRCIARNTTMDEAEVCVLCGFCGIKTFVNEIECDIEVSETIVGLKNEAMKCQTKNCEAMAEYFCDECKKCLCKKHCDIVHIVFDEHTPKVIDNGAEIMRSVKMKSEKNKRH